MVGIKVPVVCAGISIGEGQTELTSAGIKVKSVRSFPEVIDEICERDFYPGVPYSGRTLKNAGNTGIPYPLPFGDPVEWASIPENRSQDFSRFCIEQTQKLFEEIGNASGRPVLYGDINRRVFGLPDMFNKDNFTDVLNAVK